MANKLAVVKRAIREIRDNREKKKEIDELLKTSQPETIELMRSVDPNNQGIEIDPEDRKTGTAFVQQNEPSEVWDEEEIWEYVRRRKAIRVAVTSRVLDIRKWEAEVANGNVPTKVANKFKKKLDPPKPFIRFGKK